MTLDEFLQFIAANKVPVATEMKLNDETGTVVTNATLDAGVLLLDWDED